MRAKLQGWGQISSFLSFSRKSISLHSFSKTLRFRLPFRILLLLGLGGHAVIFSVILFFLFLFRLSLLSPRSELKAIRGARKLIERSPDLIIITEVSVLPFNGGDAPSFFDIHLEMEQLGFKMIEIIDYVEIILNPPNSQLLQMDIAWQRGDKLSFNGKKWINKS